MAMAPMIMVVAGIIVVVSTITAFRTPALFAQRYQRWSKVVYYAGFAGLAWVAIGAARSVTTIHQVVEDEGVSAQSALHTVRMLATAAVNEQRVYVPALLVFILSGVYIDLLGKARSRRLKADAP